MAKVFPISVEAVNDVLPQTQCELCTYKGCEPYAKAIVEQGERIDRCHPGGERVLEKLAQLTQQDPEPMRDTVIEQQPSLMVAVIREHECIGCKKCIHACPVDAIVGGPKLMHTVIADECSGCELCVEPCPVDCIDMVTIGDASTVSETTFQQKAKQYRARYDARAERLQRLHDKQRKKHKQAKQAHLQSKTDTLSERKKLIAEAIARSKQKKDTSS